MAFTVFKNRKKVDCALVDTYSTQNFWYAVVVATLCRWYQIPYIPILHGGNLPHRLQKNPGQSKKLFSGAKTNVAPSRYLFDAFQKAGFSNITYIPNAIELHNYPFEHRNSVLPRLLWVRSFAQIYHPLLAIKVFERLKELYPVAELCMVGPEKDGALKECKMYAEAKKLPVVFTGKLDKAEWIKRALHYDIFINTTNFDNTPVSVIEAMALGLPVVSTRVGGIPFLLDHKKDALLVPPNKVEDFVEAIVFLCNHASEVQNLCKNARRKAEQFNWKNVKQLWFEVLEA